MGYIKIASMWLLTLSEGRCQAVHTVGDLQQAVWAVVDGIHGGDVGQQRLRSADVGGGLVATDVLLARLHGHAERRVALRVLAQPCIAHKGHQMRVIAL